jgi:hypothetical protein
MHAFFSAAWMPRAFERRDDAVRRSLVLNDAEHEWIDSSENG